MRTLTRSVFLKTAAAAIAGKFVPGAKAAPVSNPAEKPRIVKMAELLAAVSRPDDDFSFDEVSLRVALESRYRQRPFPVPDWLAKDERWARHLEEDRQRAEGTYCHVTESTSAWTKCEGCGDYIAKSGPVHWVETPDRHAHPYHAECCAACVKAGRVSAAGARARKRQVVIRDGHFCRDAESGAARRCHGCGRFIGRNAPRHITPEGHEYHSGCCWACKGRKPGESREVPA